MKKDLACLLDVKKNNIDMKNLKLFWAWQFLNKKTWRIQTEKLFNTPCLAIITFFDHFKCILAENKMFFKNNSEF